MKKMLFALAILPAAALSGCGGGYGYAGGGYAAVGPVGYDGYYDDYYGPIYDGYWGDDGAFYYRGGAHEHRFRRGDPAHFARGPGPGSGRFHPMQGNVTPGRGMRMPHFGGPGGRPGGRDHR